MKRNHPFLLAFLVSTLSLIACSGMPKSSGGGGGGNATLSVTLVANPLAPPPATSLLSFSVDVTGLSLTPASGTPQNIALNASTYVVDLTKLQSDSAFLGTSATIPVGTYTSVTVGFSNPVLWFCTTSSQTTSGCVPGSVTKVTGGGTAAPITTSLTLAASQQTGLTISFNLANAITINSQGVPVINLAASNVLTAHSLPAVSTSLPAGQLDFVEDVTGVVTAFNAGANSPDWWASVFAQLKARGITVAFVPTFMGWKAQAGAFAPISHGFADWGTATASVSESLKSDVEMAHKNYGKIFMMPVDPQQYRPKDSIYWEAGNSATFRNAWTSAIDGNAEWVQLVTWSDFSESSQIEPYTDATLRTDIGTGFYDLNAFYAAWFLTGNQPSITHDVLYFFYRREPTDAASTAQSAPNKIVNGTPENDIELLAFLTAPGELKITIDGHTSMQHASAGVTSFKVRTAPGTPVFALERGGSDVISFKGPIQIFSSGGLPSGVIDMTYWSGSASKAGVCAL